MLITYFLPELITVLSSVKEKQLKTEEWGTQFHTRQLLLACDLYLSWVCMCVLAK